MCWCGQEHPKWQRARECPHCTCHLVIDVEVLGTPVTRCAHCDAVLAVRNGSNVFCNPAWVSSGAIN